MTHEEFFSLLETREIIDTAVVETENYYKAELPEMIKKIVSLSMESEFVDDKRLLSLKEILAADKELGTDFVVRKLIPIFDGMDNDFIVYDLQEKNWALFNIVDLCQFGKRDALSAYFE